MGYNTSMNTAAIVSALQSLIKTIELIIATLEKTKEQTDVTLPKEQLLNTMAMAIQKHEGWILNPPSRSVRNNNPGNCRFSSIGYLPKYGNVQRDKDNFAIFESYEIGMMYLKNLILEKARNNPQWNLVDFFNVYAPSADNNDPTLYAKVVAGFMGVSPTEWRLKSLT